MKVSWFSGFLSAFRRDARRAAFSSPPDWTPRIISLTWCYTAHMLQKTYNICCLLRTVSFLSPIHAVHSTEINFSISLWRLTCSGDSRESSSCSSSSFCRSLLLMSCLSLRACLRAMSRWIHKLYIILPTLIHYKRIKNQLNRMRDETLFSNSLLLCLNSSKLLADPLALWRRVFNLHIFKMTVHSIQIQMCALVIVLF